MNRLAYLLDAEAQLADHHTTERRDLARESEHYDPYFDVRYASWRSTEEMPSRAEALRDQYEMGEI